MSDAPPLSVIVNELRQLINKRSSADFSIYYDDPTLFGDLQYIRSKTRAAWEKKTQENYKKNDHQLDAKDEITRPDLLKGELEYALDRCEEALDKVRSVNSDQYNVESMLERYKQIIEEHHEAAEKGKIIHN